MSAIIAFLLAHWGWTLFLGGCGGWFVLGLTIFSKTQDDWAEIVCLTTAALAGVVGLVAATTASIPSTQGGADLGWYALAMLLTGPLVVGLGAGIWALTKNILRMFGWIRGRSESMLQWFHGKQAIRQRENARSRTTIEHRCRDGVQNASNILAANTEAGASFMAAGEKLLSTLAQMLDLHDTLEQLMSQRSVASIHQSFETTRSLFPNIQQTDRDAQIYDQIRSEHDALMDLKGRVGSVIQQIVFICDNLVVSAASVQAKSSLGEISTLHEELTSLIQQVRTDIGSEVLTSVVSGSLERELLSSLRVRA